MFFLRVLIVSSFFGLATCGDTNLGGQIDISSGAGGGSSWTPGIDLNFIETDFTDFQAGTLNQVVGVATGALELQRNFIGETGRLTIANEISVVAPTAVSFRQTYTNPVVVAYIASRNNAEPMDVRVTNVSTTGFDIFIDDPSDNGIAASETVVYLVIEAGRYNFANGLSIEADVLNTATNHSAPNGFAGDIVPFSAAFVGTPVILHTLNSYNNLDFKSSVCDSSSSTQFTLGQETAQVGSATVAEDIGWVAISQGNGTLVDINFDVATFDNGASDGISNGPQVMSYVGFANPPDVIVKGSSGGGNDGYWMRSEGTWTSVAHNAYAEEDVVGDGETSHANEIFNLAAFTPDSDIGVYYASGTRETANIDLSSVKLVQSSSLQFTTSLPAGTTAVVESNVSFDGGATWQGWVPQASGQSIAGLEEGVDVGQGLLKVRYTLSTIDEEVTPQVNALTINVIAKTSE